MNSFEQHPDTEQLDRLRAGLFDDDPQRRIRLEQHLQQCEHCRRAYDWPARLAGLEAVAETRLDALRRQALAGAPSRRRHRRLLPLATAAAMALVAVGVVSLLPSPQTPPAPPRVAASDPSRVPDLYEDLDFYLWLADHKGSADSST